MGKIALLLVILLIPSISALEINDVSASQKGDKIVFTARVSGFDSAENVSVQLHYIFSQDVGKQSTWNYSFMRYSGDREWKTEISKKGETGTVYYYVTVLYRGEQYRYPQNGSNSFVYSPIIGMDPQIACLIGFFILFIVFEIVMRYPLIKRKKGEEDEVEEKEEGGIIKCQKCEKIIPADSEKCPYCGVEIRRDAGQSKEITMGDD